MNNIIENKEELFDIYKEKLEVPFFKEEVLRREFNRFIFLKVEFMPHWFVLELIRLDYDVTDDEELMSIYEY